MASLHAQGSPWLLDLHGALALVRQHLGDSPGAQEHVRQAQAIANRHRSLPPWFRAHLDEAEALMRGSASASSSSPH
jgi:hypothetical protein